MRKSKNKDYRVIPMTDRVGSLLARLQPALAQPDEPVIRFGDIKRSLHSAGMRSQVGHVHLHQLTTPSPLGSEIAESRSIASWN